MITRAIGFLRDILTKRTIIYALAKRDFQKQYMGSYLGFVWVFLQPLIMIFILYAVFTFGFRAGATTDLPFAVYLITGIIPWMYFSENLSVASNVLTEYSYLINNMDFRLSVLPIVKILSAMVPHFFFILLAVIIAWHHGYPPSLYTLQVIYYLFAMVALLFGLDLLTSSTNIFVKDVSKVVSIIVQFGFWMTPIVWNISIVPPKYRWIIEANPVFYFVRGYRDSLVYSVPFWHHPVGTIYFWCFAIAILLFGVTVFGKLRSHFSEVI